jgi:hypothetical protein
MGARAVFRVLSDDHDGAFWSGWGSPEFTLSGLARWIEACRWRGQMPTAANYWEHGQVDPENQFTDAFPVGGPDPGDLDYRYELRATKALYGWAADLTVWSNVRPGGLSDEFAVIHRVSFSNPLTAPVPALAADGLRLLVQRATAIPGRGGYSVEAVDVWSKQATAHPAYATLDASVMNLWVAATRRRGDLEVSK